MTATLPDVKGAIGAPVQHRRSQRHALGLSAILVAALIAATVTACAGKSITGSQNASVPPVKGSMCQYLGVEAMQQLLGGATIAGYDLGKPGSTNGGRIKSCTFRAGPGNAPSGTITISCGDPAHASLPGLSTGATALAASAPNAQTVAKDGATHGFVWADGPECLIDITAPPVGTKALPGSLRLAYGLLTGLQTPEGDDANPNTGGTAAGGPPDSTCALLTAGAMTAILGGQPVADRTQENNDSGGGVVDRTCHFNSQPSSSGTQVGSIQVLCGTPAQQWGQKYQPPVSELIGSNPPTFHVKGADAGFVAKNDCLVIIQGTTNPTVLGQALRLAYTQLQR
jgi:hypothetical protein